ncbi:hypothetical protein CEXT_301161 [Caerostris extrusa]|uniref:Uncharacterized protein n=1 Tax=Caerostris extrusa TaxID=172846 RepID=A0AAV4RFA2_CAEEX|nr:hypothetical protein CEXT_301161 [Caerostris extrusa]
MCLGASFVDSHFQCLHYSDESPQFNEQMSHIKTRRGFPKPLCSSPAVAARKTFSGSESFTSESPMGEKCCTLKLLQFL